MNKLRYIAGENLKPIWNLSSGNTIQWTGVNWEEMKQFLKINCNMVSARITRPEGKLSFRSTEFEREFVMNPNDVLRVRKGKAEIYR
jgi:hypothetical protein